MLMASYKYLRRTHYDAIPGTISGIKVQDE